MCKKLIYLFSFVLVLGLVVDVQAQVWTDAGPNHLWSTPTNWSSGTVPTSDDLVSINLCPGPIIANEGAVANRVQLGTGTPGCLTIDGGTLAVGNWLSLSQQETGNGTLNMISGTLSAVRVVNVPWRGSGTLNMTGGTITAGLILRIGHASTATGHVNLHGGTIAINDFVMRQDAGAVGTMDVTAGTLIINGDKVSLVQGYIDNGWITADGGAAEFLLDFDVRNSGKTTLTTTFVAVTDKAYSPSPEHNAEDVPREVVLSWEPGEFAAPTNGHKVYFGESFDDVNDATGGLAQDANRYTPAQRLDLGKTYYWRVDEVNAPPASNVEFKGEVWSFTTEPIGYPVENITVTASSEVRADEGPQNTVNGSGLDNDDLHSAENSDMWLSNVGDADGTWIQYEFDRPYKLYQMLVWNYSSSVEPVVGFGIKEAAIEYSTDGVNWTTLGATHEFARGIGSAGYAPNTTVELGGIAAKYVKITANSNWGGMVNQYGLSEVRFLYIPVWAREPNPTPGATDVSVDTVLDWRAGREAAGHDVYLSSDEQAVIDGTAAVATVTEASYASSLDVASTYYWRIAEVNDAETPVMWQGDVWNFSTQEYIVVDDFESYNDIPVGEEGSNLVYVAWVDGFDNPSTNGSTMGYVAGASLDSDNVHGGRKSVPLEYNNTTAGLSEVVRTFTPAQDWTAHGVKTLSLWFAGDGANVPGQLYVEVNGIQVNYDGDAANLTVAGWQTWNIDLAAINTNLGNVTSMAIGIQGPGATGTLLLDDIRLYSYDRELITPVEPGTAGLQAHYEFEGNANDSSGNARHGTAVGNPFFGEGKIGQAMSFDGIDDVVEVPHSAGIGFNDSMNLTVTLWAKPIKLPRLSWTGIITKNRDVGGSAVYGIWISNSNQWHFHVGSTMGNANIPGAPEPTEEWHFVAMTHDVDATTLRGYVDGLMIYENTNSNPAPLTAQSPLWIGGSQSVTEFYPGQLEDVRIYDRTLTQEEITWLAGRTQPFDKPF